MKPDIQRSMFIFAIMASFAHPAFAYLDLGTGSFMLQMLIAGFVGALYTVKLYWYRLKSFVFRLFGKDIDNPMEPSISDEEENAEKKIDSTDNEDKKT